MARRVDDTTLGGYRCDAAGCDANGVLSPRLMVPMEGHPVDVVAPVMVAVDVHVCARHWRDLKIDDLFTKQSRNAVEECAESKGGRPAFKRAYIEPVLLHSQEFLEFQQRAGLVSPDDALAPGEIILP